VPRDALRDDERHTAPRHATECRVPQSVHIDHVTGRVDALDAGAIERAA